MECEFCKKLFSNKQTLKTHQTTSKKCRKTQENPVKPIFTCKFCLKECSSKVRLEEHETKCIEKFKIDLAEKDKRIKELEEKLAEKEKRLQQLDIKPKREREFDTLEPLNISIAYINNAILPRINLRVVEGGRNRLIKCIVENYLMENGVVRYKCTDTSRLSFTYQPTGGKKMKDLRCRKICEILKKTDIIKKCTELIHENNLSFEFLENGKAVEIESLFRHIEDFSKELATYLC